MRNLTPEEKNALVTKPLRKQSRVRSMLMQMKVDDILLIEPQDWTWKSVAPSHLCRRVEEKTDMRFECEQVLQPITGWVVTRVK